jgi:hypothetical protein
MEGQGFGTSQQRCLPRVSRPTPRGVLPLSLCLPISHVHAWRVGRQGFLLGQSDAHTGSVGPTRLTARAAPAVNTALEISAGLNSVILIAHARCLPRLAILAPVPGPTAGTQLRHACGSILGSEWRTSRTRGRTPGSILLDSDRVHQDLLRACSCSCSLTFRRGPSYKSRPFLGLQSHSLQSLPMYTIGLPAVIDAARAASWPAAVLAALVVLVIIRVLLTAALAAADDQAAAQAPSLPFSLWSVRAFYKARYDFLQHGFSVTKSPIFRFNLLGVSSACACDDCIVEPAI